MERVHKELDAIISYIKESKDYQNCLFLREKMNANTELMNKIKLVKELQKKYIRTEKEGIKEELNALQRELDEIPIYHLYNESLMRVNQMIDMVKEELNDYFEHVLN